MTVELYPYAAADPIELLITWLEPLGRTSTQRPNGAPLPFRTVRRIGGGAGNDGLTDHPLVAIHTIAATEEDATAEGELTDRAVRELAPPWGEHPPVTMSTATVYVDDLTGEDQHVVLWAGASHDDPNAEWASVGVYQLALRIQHTA